MQLLTIPLHPGPESKEEIITSVSPGPSQKVVETREVDPQASLQPRKPQCPELLLTGHLPAPKSELQEQWLHSV